MNLTLDRQQAQYILEALRVCEEQWLQTARASNAHDLQADYGNSLLRLQLVQEYIECEAREAFGKDLSTFSHHGMAIPTPTNVSASTNEQPRR